jgi:hypothetical protein
LVILLNNTEFTATDTIFINSGKKITITANGSVDIRRNTFSFSKQFFIVEGSSSELTLGEYGMTGNITIQGSEGDVTEMVSVNTNGTLILNNGVTLTGNHRNDEENGELMNGGAVVINSGTFKMYGGNIQSNSVYGHGGGVYVSSNGSFEMHDGTISDNAANIILGFDIGSSGYGGGVYVDEGGKFKKHPGNGIIAGNSANGDVKDIDENLGLPGEQVCVLIKFNEGTDPPPSDYLNRNNDADANVSLDSEVSATGWER